MFPIGPKIAEAAQSDDVPYRNRLRVMDRT